MSKKIVWAVVSAFMVLSLLIAACAPATTPPTPATPTTPSTPVVPAAPTTPAVPATPVEKEVVTTPGAPKYGGTLNLSVTGDITNFDSSGTTGGPTKDLTNQELWGGDWTKGPAGGFGTGESSWTGNPDLFDQKAGVIAESTTWTVDAAKDEGTIVYKIRHGIRWSLNPNSEASRLVAGRELTADDVVYNLKRTTTTINLSIFMATPELKTAVITKTGPWEVTVQVPLTNLVQAISRLGDSQFLLPPEVVTKYGNMENWKNVVGSGPFMLTDYVAGSVAVMVRNNNFWMKDPVGPGKGNQLPYLDSVRVLVIPDVSTRQAALRTGKVDQQSGLTWEDAAQMRKTAPALLEAETGLANVFPMLINTQRSPFSDARVRRAMLMSIDFESIKKNLNGGMGQILTFPMIYQKEYADLYINLDDLDMPAAAKELYVYNPTKAQQLLKDAGYPSGFKTSMLITSTDVDYYSVIKDMWRKVGIDLSFDIREAAAITPLRNAGTYDMTTGGKTPLAIFYLDQVFKPGATLNVSRVDDPFINDSFDKMRRAAITDLDEAMVIYRDMTKYALDKAYAIPRPSAAATTFWWPWVKNYSGELTVGYFDATWPQFVWYDQTLKKSKGY